MIFLCNKEISEKEKQAYIDYICEKRKCSPEDIIELHINIPDDESREVELDYHIHEQAIERIRRITGYLVGSMDRWNDAKKAEEHDRVKHG